MNAVIWQFQLINFQDKKVGDEFMEIKHRKLSDYRKSNFGFDIHYDLSLIGEKIYGIGVISTYEPKVKTRLSTGWKFQRMNGLSLRSMQITTALSKSLHNRAKLISMKNFVRQYHN